ncbi:phosphatase PAP2 family protein [Thiocapsa bogorovii]|uniref:phosphatase PAP2 family protein n=1 Tax=Thiocapsa bogorovii TaxID=521689 RepID=UPI001E504644|nr:phosphatase PAP2 family protein [Thiocapsa bogorovii]UHD15119.1 phosphatase PAP2 family protein [Thiocapsa bogorovii]
MHTDFIAFWKQTLRKQLETGVTRTPPTSSSGAAWLSGWAKVCLIVGLTLYLGVGYDAGFIRINAAAAAYPDWVWQCLTVFGDERVAFALALLFALRYPRVFWALVLAALIAAAYSRGFKALFDTTRPPGMLAAGTFNLIGPSHTRASFPSGHSATAAVFFGVLIYYARWTWLRALFLTLAVLAGVSRIAVGVHWPVDVAAGLFGGALAAWLGAVLAARWPGPATNLQAHVAVVGLAVILAITLLFDDGGYHAAATPLAVLGVLALGIAGTQYLIRPWLGYRRGS